MSVAALRAFDWPTLERVDSPGGRAYVWPDGIAHPSVTTVLRATMPADKREALNGWLAKPGNAEVGEAAADRGRTLHEAIEAYFETGDEAASERLAGAWWRSIRPLLPSPNNVIAVEKFVAHRKRNYAGALDALVDDAGRVVLYDWKTSTRPKRSDWIEDYRLQGAAYVGAIFDLTGVVVDEVRITFAHANERGTEFTMNSGGIARAWAGWRERLKAFDALRAA
jgi:genome maintenance exonuclease 1